MSFQLTPAQLVACVPGLSTFKGAGLHSFLLGAMEEAHINTPLRVAAFLAQTGHESYSYKYMEEIWGPTAQQMKYEPPSKVASMLGNTQKGDGLRYKGRGPIQLTGRANYRECGKDLGLDLEAHPELAARPDAAFRVAAWYWTTRKLNDLADKADFDTITLRINGGQNGADDRRRRYDIAKRVLGIGQPVVG